MAPHTPLIRRILRVRGVVQGVGYRPFVYQLAVSHGLSGLVGNDSDGVFAEVEGPPESVEAFCRTLEHAAPPLARVESVEWRDAPPGDIPSLPGGFVIVESRRQDDAVTLISPDLAICDDCLRELQDPTDRRFGYPFVNCTNCGPRFSITAALPYDRPNTTMAGFEMCAECRAEYDNPLDRRFHAQPIACPRCGPSVWLETAGGVVRSRGETAIAEARGALLSGRIVAVKGLGGFHLACDATRDDAVETLRARKGRVDKPFAVMCADVDQARRFAEIDAEEAALLSARERPIVLLRARTAPAADSSGGPDRLSAAIAPGTLLVGLMLPYTPLHHLLVRGMPPLVMTSGNLSDEPIVKDNAEARDRLGALADEYLMHDRDIHMWCDDSVVRVVDGRELPVRRSRGYAPLPVRLAAPAPRILAVGGELKATFCLTHGHYAFVSQHIGDMESLATLNAFERAVTHFIGLFGAVPEAVACDMHPGYLSRGWARKFASHIGVPVHEVQHHHAHIAAVLAEHRRDSAERVIGVSFDGTGYGLDGAIWGGEILVADQIASERVGHLRYVPLPGGDAAVRKPYRAALAWLWRAGIEWTEDLPCVATCAPAERSVLARQLERGVNCADTSSAGRLFDAVAALAGGRQRVSYEAQAALEFEADAAPTSESAYAFGISGVEPRLELDPEPVIRDIIRDIRIGKSRGEMSSRFHAAVAEAISAAARRVRDSRRLNTVVLSGGVFQNVLLLRLATHRLTSAGFEVLTHRIVPPNDGGLALGQAAVVAGLLANGRRSA